MNWNRDESIPTRASLLERLKDWRDDESWREFFKTYWRLIYRFGLRQGLSDSEAQDVVQETLLAAAKELPEFRYDPAVCKFKSWLLNVTSKRVANQIKKRKRESARQVGAEGGPGEPSHIEELLDPASIALEECWEAEWKENLSAVALEKLKRRVNPAHYRAFFLLLSEPRPAAEVAKLVGMSTAQVYLIKHRLTGQLKRIVKDLELKPI